MRQTALVTLPRGHQTADAHGCADSVPADHYEQRIGAYVRGLAARAKAGEPIGQIHSVASFFLSRIDTKVDAQLPEDSSLRGAVALASARLAYQSYVRRFSGAAWERLEDLGATRQRPLWASTGKKNPAYFCDSYRRLLDRVTSRAGLLGAPVAPG